MSNSDYIGLVASYVYATTLLVVGEALRRLFGQKPEVTRKIIHIGAGMWVFGVLVLFDHWESGIVPFATFIFLNYLFYRYRIVGAMDTEDSSPGTVYFAVSVTLLFGLLWRPDGPVDRAPIAVAGVMAMTWQRTVEDHCNHPSDCRRWSNGYDLGRCAGSINWQANWTTPLPCGAK